MSKKKSKSEKELIAKMEFVEKYGLEIPKKTFSFLLIIYLYNRQQLKYIP